jgi:hypothetical protein
MSPLSKAWLEGFLSGNEPDPFEALGLEPSGDDLSDEQYAAWGKILAEFHRTGWFRRPERGEE